MSWSFQTGSARPLLVLNRSLVLIALGLGLEGCKPVETPAPSIPKAALKPVQKPQSLVSAVPVLPTPSPAPPPKPSPPAISKRELYRRAAAAYDRVMKKASENGEVAGLFADEESTREVLEWRKARQTEYQVANQLDERLGQFGELGGPRGIADRVGDSAGRIHGEVRIVELTRKFEQQHRETAIARGELAWKHLTEEERSYCEQVLPTFFRLGTGAFRKEWQQADKAIVGGSATPEVLLAHGKLAVELDLTYQGLEDFTKALQQTTSPNIVHEAECRRAELFFRHGQIREALQSFRHALANPGPLENQAQVGEIRCLLYLKDPEGAITACSQVLEKQPDNVEVILLRVDAYRTLNQVTKAKSEVERAEKLAPGSALTIISRSGLLVDDGRFDEALRIISKGLESDPDNFKLLDWRKRIHIAAGNKFSAMTDKLAADKLRSREIGRWP